MTKEKKYGQYGTIGVLMLILALTGCQGTSGKSMSSGNVSNARGMEAMDESPVTNDLSIEFQPVQDTIHLSMEEVAKIELKVEIQETVLYHFDFLSSNEDICKVMRDGTILGISPGMATVTIKDRFSGKQEAVAVWVEESTEPREIRFSLEELTLVPGEGTTIQPTILPESSEAEPLIWSSSNESVATVSSQGKVNAIAKGECVITVALQTTPEVKAQLRVQVLKPDGQADSGTNDTSHTTGMNGTANNGDTGSNGTANNGNTGNNGTADAGNENSGGGESASSAYYVDSYAEQVLSIVNARRAEAGLAPLTMNYTLVSAAKVRAAETVQSFSHTRPNGTGCFTAFDEAGVGYSGAGENIAAGQWSPDSVMNSWMNSEGHRANILDGRFTQIGIACYYDPDSQYGYYWVQCFIY